MESIKKFREELLEIKTGNIERFEKLKAELLDLLNNYENELNGVNE